MSGLENDTTSMPRASVNRRILRGTTEPGHPADETAETADDPALHTSYRSAVRLPRNDNNGPTLGSASAVAPYRRPSAELARPKRTIPVASLATVAALVAVGILAVIVFLDTTSETPTEVPTRAQSEADRGSEPNEATPASREREADADEARSASDDDPQAAAPAAETNSIGVDSTTDPIEAPPTTVAAVQEPDTPAREPAASPASSETDAEAKPSSTERDSLTGGGGGAPARLVDADDSSTAYSVFSDGTIFLRGRISEADSLPIIAAAEAILGPDSVVNEYIIDDSVEVDKRPFFVEDLILFEPGGSTIAAEFDALISAGVLLLQREPTAKVIILGFTDSTGDAADNIALSEQRVQAIINRAIELGADRSQLVGRGLGEADPIADNGTEAGRRLNRRVEFVLEGIVG